jgi:NADP-dependent 3-hydroxy acid dehydrogenase YdfG
MAVSETRIVVITGGSAGIGAALGGEVVRRGGRVVLAARSAETLRQVATDLGPAAHAVIADVTRRADVERIRDEAMAMFGGVDVWVNNAGRGIARPVLELTDTDVDEMIAVNVKSALYGMQTIVPYFIKRGRGHLINVSSFLGRVPLASPRSVYSAAKAALNSLTTNLRMDLAATAPSVHVSLVMPGIVTTAFARNARGAAEQPMPAPPPNAPMQPQTPETVAAIIADLMDHPAAERFTNPSSVELQRRHFASLDAE